MKFRDLTFGFAFTGSHCTYDEVIDQLVYFRQQKVKIIPILSNTVSQVDSRFGEAHDWCERISEAAGHKPWTKISETEAIGPKRLLDCLVIAPCTGNTMARLSQAFTDGPVLMAAKAQMRNHRPVVIAISTNDALGLNLSNIARLITSKDIYFVPMGQDDPLGKPKSLKAHMSLIMDTCHYALKGKQIQPLFIPHPLVDVNVNRSRLVEDKFLRGHLSEDVLGITLACNG